MLSCIVLDRYFSNIWLDTSLFSLQILVHSCDMILCFNVLPVNISTFQWWWDWMYKQFVHAYWPIPLEALTFSLWIFILYNDIFNVLTNWPWVATLHNSMSQYFNVLYLILPHFSGMIWCFNILSININTTLSNAMF